MFKISVQCSLFRQVLCRNVPYFAVTHYPFSHLAYRHVEWLSPIIALNERNDDDDDETAKYIPADVCQVAVGTTGVVTWPATQQNGKLLTR